MGDDSRALRHARLRTGNQPARRPACAEAACAPVAFRFLKMPQKSAGRRPDASQKLILLSLKEWCAYLTNDAKAWQIVLRFFILFFDAGPGDYDRPPHHGGVDGAQCDASSV